MQNEQVLEKEPGADAIVNAIVKPSFSAKSTHDYFNNARQSLNMSFRFVSAPEIQKDGPCVPHGVQALPDPGLEQRPTLEHCQVLVISIVDDAEMANNIVTFIGQIFEATVLPRFRT